MDDPITAFRMTPVGVDNPVWACGEHQSEWPGYVEDQELNEVVAVIEQGRSAT